MADRVDRIMQVSDRRLARRGTASVLDPWADGAERERHTPGRECGGPLQTAEGGLDGA